MTVYLSNIIEWPPDFFDAPDYIYTTHMSVILKRDALAYILRWLELFVSSQGTLSRN